MIFRERSFEGMPHSEETKMKMSDTIKKPRAKFTCIGCKSVMTVQNFKKHTGVCGL